MSGIVLCPFSTIIKDQFGEAEGFGVTACGLIIVMYAPLGNQLIVEVASVLK